MYFQKCLIAIINNGNITISIVWSMYLFIHGVPFIMHDIKLCYRSENHTCLPLLWINYADKTILEVLHHLHLYCQCIYICKTTSSVEKGYTIPNALPSVARRTKVTVPLNVNSKTGDEKARPQQWALSTYNSCHACTRDITGLLEIHNCHHVAAFSPLVLDALLLLWILSMGIVLCRPQFATMGWLLLLQPRNNTAKFSDWKCQPTARVPKKKEKCKR